MLVGRDAEIQQLHDLLDDVRGGHARSLLVVGDAGIGKTALVQTAVDIAPDFTWLPARGIECEGEVAGAVLAELLGQPSCLRPELGAALKSLPKRLRRAIFAAQSLHPLPGDRFAVVAAWAALLVAVCETRPVLVVLDDGQWADAASLEPVLFAARRLHDVPVATLVAVREPPKAPAAFDGLERLELGVLDHASAMLLATRDGVAALDVVEAAGGNPLALVEMARRGAVSARDEVAGTLFGSRVAGLTRDGRRTLLVAALAGPLETDVLAVAGGSAGVAELIRLGLATASSGVLELVHPLVRALIRDRAGTSEQRSAHAALAAALPPGPSRTHHNALAATQPDAALADEVERLGVGGPPGLWALGMAAELTPPGHRRDRRLLAATQAAFDARDIVAARGFIDRVSTSPTVDIQLGVDELRARFKMADGARVDGARELTWVAQRVSTGDPARAVRLFVSAAIAIASSTAGVDEARAVIDQAAELVGDDPVLELHVEFAQAELLGASGHFVAAQRAFRDLAERHDPQRTVHADLKARLLLLEAMYDGGLTQRAREVAAVTIAEARANGALGDLHVALACRFNIELAAARFNAAEDAAVEELELGTGLGRADERREALGHLAWCDALKGREVDCRRHLEERRLLSEQMGLGESPHPSPGLLLLGLGDAAGAVSCLKAVDEHYAKDGRRSAASLRPYTLDLVEALLRVGERSAAAATLEAFETDARLLDRPLAMALACRGRGMLAIGDDADREFEQSLGWDLLEPSPFERAHTQLVWGENLRRRRIHGAAAEQLEVARNSFERSGAALWVTRADWELAANGKRLQPRQSTGAPLTSQERRVTDLVVSGLTNRDVAAQMFLSVNTVETHLRSVYRKLGVSTRTQLAAQVHGNP